MAVLAGEQRNIFQDQGFILLENAIDTELLEGLQNDFNGWVKDSINHQQPYGEMLDGRPRFDLEPGHSKEQPALRRVASPTEISAICLKVVFSSHAQQVLLGIFAGPLKLLKKLVKSGGSAGARTPDHLIKSHVDTNNYNN
jgi:hypothetical protein